VSRQAIELWLGDHPKQVHGCSQFNIIAYVYLRLVSGDIAKT